MIKHLLYDNDVFRTARSVEDPYWFKTLIADPDTAYNVNTDPDRRFYDKFFLVY